MPGGDRTGPLGQGPMTGRGLGFCSGNNTPGYSTPGFFRRFGRGFGRGFGRRFWRRGQSYWGRGYYPNFQSDFYDNINPQAANEEEKIYLEQMIKGLEEEIKAIKERLQELSKEKKEKNP